MEGQSKKIFSLVGSIILGVIIIFIAWASGSLTGTRSQMIAKQSENSLSVVPSPAQVPSMLAFWNAPVGTKNLSSSTTDVLTYNLITNYTNTLAKSGTSTLDANAIDAQAQALEDKIKLPPSVQYQLKDITTSIDNSSEARVTYAKAVGDFIVAFAASQTKNDMEIVFGDYSTLGETARSADLNINISHYKALEQNLLGVKVPSTIAQLHLELLQTFSDMQNSLSIMGEIYNDPAKGLAAIAQYKNANENLLSVLANIQTAVQKSI